MKRLIKTSFFTIFIMLLNVTIALALSPMDVADTDYGSYANSYLQEIVQNYPGRVFAENQSRACGDYIIDKLSTMGYKVHVDEFQASNPVVTGRNIYCEKKGQSDKLIIMCAHYDCVATQGCDDNGSGVSVLLETAQRILNMERPDCNIRFIFFDDEEQGYIGSKAYVNSLSQEELGRILYVINIDSVAGGDNLYIHGGTEAGEQTAFRDMALAVSGLLGLGMTTHEEVTGIPAGTRYWGSDHHYFAEKGIPYIYLEANIYSSNSADGNPVHYQTADPRVTGGKIMHSEFDSYQVIEELFPGRIADHLRKFTILMMDIAVNIDRNGVYTGEKYLPATEREPETTQAPETTTEEETETTEITTEATTEETTEETTAQTTIAETTIIETTRETTAEMSTATETLTAESKAENDTGKSSVLIIVVIGTSIISMLCLCLVIVSLTLRSRKKEKEDKTDIK